MRYLLPSLCTLALLIPGRASHTAGKPRVGFYLSALGGMIHRAPAFGADVFLDFGYEGFEMVVGAPLRFHEHGIRMADWDEVDDFGRLVRGISYRYAKDDLAVETGISTLGGATLGLGNLVYLYASTVDRDHWRTGFSGSLQAPMGGIAVFVDSVTGPEVIGGRLSLRLLQALDPHGLFGRLELGGTAVVDMEAPESYRYHGGDVVLSPHGLPEADRRKVFAVGFDARWPIVSNDAVEVVPYIALSSVLGGSGIHAGMALEARPTQDVEFGMAGEFRRLGKGYVSSYFDGLYMVDRWDYGGRPKAAALDLDPPGTRNGMLAAVHFRYGRYAGLFAVLDLDQDGRNNRLTAGVDLDFPGVLDAGVRLVERGFATAARLVHPDRILAAFQVAVEVSQNLAVLGSYARDLRTSNETGLYVPTDTFTLGIRFSLGNQDATRH